MRKLRFIAWLFARPPHDTGCVTVIDDRPLPALTSWQHQAMDDSGCLLWPEDPDEVPAWRLELEDRASALGWTQSGVKLPPYRTRREMERCVALCAQSSNAGYKPEKDPRIMSVDDLAAAFLSHLRHEVDVGEFSAAEIGAFYSEFCTIQNIEPCSVDHVKAALAGFPGVHRGVHDQRIDGKRRRTIRWVIEPVDIHSDLPMADDEGGDVVAFRQAA